MRLADTAPPLALASIAAVVVEVLLLFFTAQPPRPVGGVFLLVIGRLWILALAAQCVLVLPLLILVPSLRKPPLWIAAIWGAAAAVGFATLTLGWTLIAQSSRTAITELALTGSIAGIVYAVVARRSRNTETDTRQRQRTVSLSRRARPSNSGE